MHDTNVVFIVCRVKKSHLFTIRTLARIIIHHNILNYWIKPKVNHHKARQFFFFLFNLRSKTFLKYIKKKTKTKKKKIYKTTVFLMKNTRKLIEPLDQS